MKATKYSDKLNENPSVSKFESFKGESIDLTLKAEKLTNNS